MKSILLWLKYNNINKNNFDSKFPRCNNCGKIHSLSNPGNCLLLHQTPFGTDCGTDCLKNEFSWLNKKFFKCNKIKTSNDTSIRFYKLLQWMKSNDINKANFESKFPRCPICNNYCAVTNISNSLKNNGSPCCLTCGDKKHHRLLMEQLGYMIPLKFKKNWELYYMLVHNETKKSIRKHKIIKPSNEYDLDHKFSIFCGFNNGILPIYIGNINNLEYLKIDVNRSKKTNCSITKDELFDGYIN